MKKTVNNQRSKIIYIEQHIIPHNTTDKRTVVENQRSEDQNVIHQKLTS